MNKSKRKRHQPVRLSSLFSRVLPENYRDKGATIQHFQAFFHSQTDDAVYQTVQVLNVSDTTLSLSVPSPALVNYLRLHTEEIRQQIREQFGQTLELKISASPSSLKAQLRENKLSPAQHFDQSVCDRVRRSATGVEDEDLQQALIKLARSMGKNPGS